LDRIPLPSVDELRQQFCYDPTTGILSRRSPKFQRHLIFKFISERGYIRGRVNGKLYMAHRIIWKMVHGTEPQEIDHINGVKTDNRIENLRAVDRTGNCRNLSISKLNTTGVTGVVFNGRQYIAQIGINGKCHRLGGFYTLEEAVSARKQAEKEQGYHPNHGKPAYG